MLDISTLNEAQQRAVTSQAKSLLIIAGAGSGKTRTLIYRLAWLIEQGIPLHNMLLLTFTRKAAAQMLERASLLTSQDMRGMRSGTFHAFAISVLRQHPQFCLRFSDNKSGGITLLDSPDQSSAIAHCKDELKIGKGDRSFPKSAAIISLLSKARNKETSIGSLLKREAQHLLPYEDSLESLAKAYYNYKKTKALYDYDDLLFELDTLFTEEPHVLKYYQDYYPYVMVDEYQDTNKVQSRIIRHLAGNNGNVMAVGDDAQSIYAFRGATVRNILDFPKIFPNTETIYLEENYRSYQPILDVANAVLSQASEGYKKHLFSTKSDVLITAPVRMYKTSSDISQAKVARQYIQDLLLNNEPTEITVLFRSGFHAFHLELELKKFGIDFKKVGGIKYTEAAHVKDFLAYARLINNPQDSIAFKRLASFAKGVGEKTAQKIYELSLSGEIEKFNKQMEKYPDLHEDIKCVNNLRTLYSQNTGETNGLLLKVLNTILEKYKPHVEHLYPDDYPKRLQGLEEILGIAMEYKDLDLFISDLVLDPGEEDDESASKITLSTVHSAKGLEWDNVLIMDLAEERFPSRLSMTREEDFEEERRLMYVACTRARKSLALFVPSSLYHRQSQSFENAMPSPFIYSIPRDGYDEYKENIGGGVFLNTKPTEKYRNPLDDYAFAPSYNREKASFGKHNEFKPVANAVFTPPKQEKNDSVTANTGQKKMFGYCTHKIFGRGKILEEVDNDKYKINFQNIGVKTILKAFVTLD